MNPDNSSDLKLAELLRHWRRLRGVSQQELASALDHSVRHLSFLETGKASPSLATLRNVISFLEIPSMDADQLIKLAGYAPKTQDEAGEWEALDPIVEQTLTALVAGIRPHAAAVVDARQRMVRMNLTTAAYMSAFGDIDTLFDDGYLSWARLIFHQDGIRHVMPNWEDTAWSLIQMIHRDRYRIPAVAEKVYQDILKLTELPLDWQRLDETVSLKGGAPLRFSSTAGVATLQRVSFMVTGHPSYHTHDYPELSVFVFVATDVESVRMVDEFNEMVTVNMVHPNLRPALAYLDQA